MYICVINLVIHYLITYKNTLAMTTNKSSQVDSNGYLTSFPYSFFDKGYNVGEKLRYPSGNTYEVINVIKPTPQIGGQCFVKFIGNK